MAQAVTTSRDESGNVIPHALREAGYAALISFGLFVLLIGLKTDQNIRNELILVPRWGLLAIIVAITAIGRFAYVAYAAPYFIASRRAAAQYSAGLRGPVSTLRKPSSSCSLLA